MKNIIITVEGLPHSDTPSRLREIFGDSQARQLKEVKMKVIKAVANREGKLVSTFARGEWQKEYAKGVETKPDIGYLFAYSSKNMRGARSSMGMWPGYQYWLAEAEVVGRISGYNIAMQSNWWRGFWADLKLQLRRKGAEYLLCSSITLIRKLT